MEIRVQMDRLGFPPTKPFHELHVTGSGVYSAVAPPSNAASKAASGAVLAGDQGPVFSGPAEERDSEGNYVYVPQMRPTSTKTGPRTAKTCRSCGTPMTGFRSAGSRCHQKAVTGGCLASRPMGLWPCPAFFRSPLRLSVPPSAP